MDAADAQVFHDLQTSISAALENPSENTLPDIQTLTSSKTDLLNTLPVAGHGLEKTTSHILQTIVPALTRAPHSRYYGFVTGGVTPPAYLADNLVTLCDQNVSVHLPGESIATVVEDRSLCMLLQLLDFAPGDWRGRTLTTGATASNILGLACGREWVLAEKLRRWGRELRVGEGLLGACLRAGVGAWQVLTTSPHSSLGKAANVVGVGSSSMIDVSSEGEGGHPLHFDMARLEGLLANPDTATIVVISCGEINTGGFATGSVEEVEQIRKLCNRYGAWLHVDGAFGLLARALPDTPQYTTVRRGTAGLHLADSITGDAHKLLNVPYDCGFFVTRHLDTLTRVCQHTNAAYLSTTPSVDGITSPCNVRLENSSRFRALPVYATLMSYGRTGYASMIARMVDLSRLVACFIRDECPELELLPKDWYSKSLEGMFMCVLFRARDEGLNAVLKEKINATRRVYASGTSWEGKPAVRFAVAKWDVDVKADLEVVKGVLRNAL